MIYTNEYGLPGPIETWLKDDQYEHSDDPNHYSATELCLPYRAAILIRRHKHEIVKDVSQCIKMQIGTACHNAIYEANKRAGFPWGMQEERMFYTHGDFRVGGQMDWYDEGGKMVTDWKFTSVWAVMNQEKAEWVKQLNIYAHLLRENDKPIEFAQIGAFCTDWRIGESLKYGSKYPPIMYMSKPIMVWDDDVIKGAIDEQLLRMGALKDVPDDKLPMCSADERWLRDEKWAVMKGGRKSAVRLFDREDEAYTYIRDFVLQPMQEMHDVAHRPGVNIRCQDYCDARQFCSFYKENVNVDK